MKRWILPAVFFIVLIIILFVFLLRNQAIRNNQAILIPTPPPEILSSKNVEAQVKGAHKPIVSSYSAPKTENGITTVTITGTLTNFSKNGNGNYFAQIVVNYDNKEFPIAVDLGPANYQLLEYSIDVNPDPTTDDPSRVLSNTSFTKVSSEMVYEKFKNKTGSLLSFEILTQLPNTDPNQIQGCNGDCALRINLFKSYASANKSLEIINELNPNTVIGVGGVVRMTGGQYVL